MPLSQGNSICRKPQGIIHGQVVGGNLISSSGRACLSGGLQQEEMRGQGSSAAGALDIFWGSVLKAEHFRKV